MSEMLAMLVEQTEAAGGDLVMIRALVEEASEAGAARALERVGLSDRSAGQDIDELRDLLRGWRDAKKAARAAVLGWVVRLSVALLLLGLAVKLDLARMLRP